MKVGLKAFLATSAMLVALSPLASTTHAADNVNYKVKVLEDTLGIVVSADTTNINVAGVQDAYNGTTNLTIENAGTGTINLTSRIDTTNGSFKTGDLSLVTAEPTAEKEISITYGTKKLSATDQSVLSLGFNWDTEKGEKSTAGIDFKLGNNTPLGTYTVPVVFTASR